MSTTKECWSFNGEAFNHDTLGDLMDEYVYDLKPGDEVWRATAKLPSISSLADADSVIEDIGERAYDYGGEYAEDYPEVTPEHKAKLQMLLEQWLTECPEPRFYQVGAVTRYILQRDDFTEEQLAEIALQEDDKRAAQAAQGGE